ncbi:MAG TPA: MFS transporter [Chthonomonadaceae bacterium]|nr:MFS transporter [Chthonomonadaceae bacterium]
MTDTAQAVPMEEARLRAWQRLTMALLFLGYAGYYVCRVHLSVATPLLIKSLGSQGVDKVFIGGFVSLGTLCYAIGKFVNGTIADFVGGRRMFLFGMVGAIVFTLLFGLGGIPFFTIAWMLNRLVQSTGWVGMVKITSRWFSYPSYGAAMGIISLSFLLGDAGWRWVLGLLIRHGLDWPGVFVVSALTLTPIFLLCLILVKESPKDVGLPEPAANPGNVFGQAGQEEHPIGLGDLLLPLLRSGAFWAVCMLSLGFTLVRETFGTWTPEYLTEVIKMQAGPAGQASAFFPLFGAVSTLVCGFYSDRVGAWGRAAMILIGLILSIPLLLMLGYMPFHGSAVLAVLVLSLVAFLLIGPYTFLAGAIALDFGGKKGSATACGWIDGIGYVGAIFAGEGIGSIAQRLGWGPAFGTLAGVAALSCIAATVYLVQSRSHVVKTMEKLSG